MARGDIELPKAPTPPSSPAKALSMPARPPNPSRTFVNEPRGFERATAEDLALETRGPLSSKRDVDRQLAETFGRRRSRQMRQEARLQRELNRPVQLKGRR